MGGCVCVCLCVSVCLYVCLRMGGDGVMHLCGNGEDAKNSEALLKKK